MRGSLARALAGACMFVILGGASFYAQNVQRSILPPEIAPEASVHRLVPGGTVLIQPVALPPSIRLASEVKVAAAGKSAILAADRDLVGARIKGVALPPLSPDSIVYCDAFELNPASVVANRVAFGLLGGLTRTGGVARFCVFDADDDRRVDHVVLIGAKSRADAVPHDVDPVSYTTQGGVATPDSDIRLIYVGPVGIAGGVAFDLVVRENGKAVTLPLRRTVVKKQDLPASIAIQGAQIEVRGFDPTTGAADIAVRSAFTSGEYDPVAPPTPAMIPIYIPH